MTTGSAASVEVVSDETVPTEATPFSVGLKTVLSSIFPKVVSPERALTARLQRFNVILRDKATEARLGTLNGPALVRVVASARNHFGADAQLVLEALDGAEGVALKIRKRIYASDFLESVDRYCEQSAAELEGAGYLLVVSDLQSPENV